MLKEDRCIYTVYYITVGQKETSSVYIHNCIGYRIYIVDTMRGIFGKSQAQLSSLGKRYRLELDVGTIYKSI